VRAELRLINLIEYSLFPSTHSS